MAYIKDEDPCPISEIAIKKFELVTFRVGG